MKLSQATVGLTNKRAAELLLQVGANELATEKPRNLLQQIWAVAKEPMLFLLLVAGILNLAISEPLDGIILFLFVLVVVVISIYQERKSENALAALRELSAPKALVIRDEREVSIASRELVPGDLVVINEGDRIPADGYLVQNASLIVDESSLTGESVAVSKTAAANNFNPDLPASPGGEGSAWVFSGTMAVRGRAIVRITATGPTTQLGQIGNALQDIKTSKTPLQREVNSLVKTVAVIGLATAITVTVVYGLTRDHWLEGLLAGIATAMAMLPEEFGVVITVFMALGAWRLTKEHVLARRSEVIETLGSATVICTDKTGTITKNQMSVSSFVIGDNTFAVREPKANSSIATISQFAVLASAEKAFDPMEKAFHEHAKLPVGYHLEYEYPLSDSLMAMVQVWANKSGARLIAAKGAPEAIAKLCRLNKTEFAKLETQVKESAANGQRVLAIAQGRFELKALPKSVTEIDFELLGLANLYDPVRKGVKEAIAECYQAGIRTIMITGDYPATALSIANSVGIDTKAGVLTGPEVSALSDVELALRIREVNVFARMVPSQKLQLIRALKADGEVVAMTGDGVNDSPALKAADIGIAMGKRGTDVAREAAGLVLTDDNFTSIVSAIKSGRGIFENIRKALSYVIAVHIPILGMTLIPVLGFDLPLVLVPVLIAFLELIIDPACSVVFEAEAVEHSVMHKKPRGLKSPIFDRRVLTIAVLQGLSVLLAVLAVYAIALNLAWPSEQVRAVSFATLLLSNLGLILINRSWNLSAFASLVKQKNPTIKWMLGGGLLLLISMINLPVVNESLNLTALSIGQWAIAIAAAILGLTWFEIYKKFQHSKL